MAQATRYEDMMGVGTKSHTRRPVVGSMLVPFLSQVLNRATSCSSKRRVSWKVAFIHGSSKQGNAWRVYTGCACNTLSALFLCDV